MPLDPHECHEYAQRCMNLAAVNIDLNPGASEWTRCTPPSRSLPMTASRMSSANALDVALVKCYSGSRQS